MKKGKGDSGKAYHVQKDQKKKKNFDKELDEMIDNYVTDVFRTAHRRILRKP